MHNPRLQRIRRALENSAALGDIKRITSHFSFEAADDFLHANIRSDPTLEPLGCLGDLGWYNIRFALWTMNWQLPREVSGRILSQAGRQQGQNQVPFEFSGELIFPQGVSSGFYCSFLTTYSNWAIVTGTKGEVRVPDFALPKNSSEGALETNGTLADDLVVDPLTAQETNMVRAFSAQVLSRKLNPDWVDWALKTQIVINACLEAARAGRPVSL
jgi:predicted dehydrogenase